MITIRVMAFNIAEGSNLDAVATTIRGRDADIVLLSEVRWIRSLLPWRTDPRHDQTRYLAQQLGYAFRHYQEVALTGFTGSKGVSILSRHPLRNLRLHTAPGGSLVSKGFGTLQATVQIAGRDHQVFATRFAPMHAPDSPAFDPQAEANNRAAHQQALQLVRAVPAHVRLVFGGDLNAAWSQTSPTGGQPPGEWARAFRDESGLKEVLREHPNPHGPGRSNCFQPSDVPHGPADTSYIDNRVDYLYYRGPYEVSDAEFRCGAPAASDHPYLVATLVEPQPEGPHPGDPQEPDPCEDLRNRIRSGQRELKALQAELSDRRGRPKRTVLRLIADARVEIDDLRRQARSTGCTNIP